MSNSGGAKSQGQIGSLAVSALFVVVGLITLYDTVGYMDRDSQVFPRAVAIGLIVTASISFVSRLMKPSTDGGFGQGVWWRRLLLVSAMLVASLMMPIIGFLPAAAIAFAGGLIAAMHDRWSAKLAVLYCSSGVVIMIGFFALFKYALHVPLP